MSISSRIRGLCEQKDITINQLEKESGIGRNSIARWDSHSPSVEKVASVADYFGVSVEYLLTGEAQKENPAGVSAGGQAEKLAKALGDIGIDVDSLSESEINRIARLAKAALDE